MISWNHLKQKLGWLVHRSQLEPAEPLADPTEQRDDRLKAMVQYMKANNVAEFSYEGCTVVFNPQPPADARKAPTSIDDRQDQLRFLRETAEELAKDEDINLAWST